MATNTAVVTVGKLLEIRADAGYRTPEDVDAVFAAVGQALSKLPGDGAHVTVVDWRLCPLMSPEAAKHMLEMIASVNSNTIRSAALADEKSPGAVLQFVRLIREANLPDRKLFTHADELETWLSEVLTPQEKVRLHEFLARK